MARQIHKLRPAQVERFDGPGLLSDGGGLYLAADGKGRKSWVFRYVLHGRQHDMGLGAAGDAGASLQEARDRATDARRILRDGLCPLTQRRETKARAKMEAEAQSKASRVPTFRQCAEQFITDMGPKWTSLSHLHQWKQSLRDYAGPINGKRVDEIGTDDIAAVLKPIWTAKHETATRLRGRLENVLDMAIARGYRADTNPAKWSIVRHLLPTLGDREVNHFRALPYAELPGLMSRLRDVEGMAARALEFQVLTAARPGEARGVLWSEIDLAARTWVIPAKRMKGKRQHVVPLSDRAVEILQALQAVKVSEAVFANVKPRDVTRVLKTLNVFDRLTPHGCRSVFRDWCGDETSFPREVAESALAHVVGDRSEQAYRRGNALAKRAQLMTAWADYCAGKTADVLSLRAA